MLRRNIMQSNIPRDYSKNQKRGMGNFDTYCKRCMILKCTNYGNFEMRL